MKSFRDLQNYTTLKLGVLVILYCFLVLEIYRITLLSNKQLIERGEKVVLEIYRITLLSNNSVAVIAPIAVLEIYRITLLSNRGMMR